MYRQFIYDVLKETCSMLLFTLFMECAKQLFTVLKKTSFILGKTVFQMND